MKTVDLTVPTTGIGNYDKEINRFNDIAEEVNKFWAEFDADDYAEFESPVIDDLVEQLKTSYETLATKKVRYQDFASRLAAGYKNEEKRLTAQKERMLAAIDIIDKELQRATRE